MSYRKASETEKLFQAEKLRQCEVGEDFYEGDNPLEESDDEEDSDDEESEEEDQEQDGEKMKKRDVCSRSKRRLVSHMSLQRTLSFCYLGLLYTKHVVTASDVVRWAQCGKIPYHSAVTLLPEDIKFSTTDSHIFHRPVSVNIQIYI